MTKTQRYVLIALVIVAIVMWAFSFNFSGKETAGKLLDQEIQLQRQKQEALDTVSNLDTQILEIRAKRNELQKQEVCAWSGCYMGF